MHILILHLINDFLMLCFLVFIGVFHTFCCVAFVLQPEAPAASSLHPRVDEEDDGDLNKALGVQRFQQILSPAASVPDEQHHNYHEEDIECERTSSTLWLCSSPSW